MKAVFYALAAAGVVLAFFAGFALLDWTHRMKRRRVRGIAGLRPRKLARTQDVPTGLPQAQAIERLAAAFAGRSPVVPYRTDSELVMFWGEAGGLAQFRGIASMHAEEMPLRLAAAARGCAVRVTIDEDFGFHLFVGPARRIFDDLYQQALDHAAPAARQAFEGRA
jgi:hypothetical protein